MSKVADIAYYTRRAEAARRMAGEACDPHIRAIDLRMPHEYDGLARSPVRKLRFVGEQSALAESAGRVPDLAL